MADFGDRHNGPMCNSMHIMSNGDLLSRKPPVAQIPCLARVLAARPRVLRPDDSFRWPKRYLREGYDCDLLDLLGVFYHRSHRSLRTLIYLSQES